MTGKPRSPSVCPPYTLTNLFSNSSVFKSPLGEDWTPASAHYEIACLNWHEKDLPNTTHEDHKKKVLACEQELLKTQKFDQYVLDGRLSIRVTTSLVTVRRWKGILGI
jgi:hypothetical protein